MEDVKTGYDEWPARARAAFEAYWALTGERTLEAVAAQPGMPSLDTLKKWSSRYGFKAEIARRLAEEAASRRKQTQERRDALRDNIETGLSSLAQRFSLRATGVCPGCRGRRKVASHEPGSVGPVDCPECLGTGRSNPDAVKMSEFQRVIHSLGELWDRPVVEESGEETESGISQDRFKELQRDMLRRSGFVFPDEKDS